MIKLNLLRLAVGVGTLAAFTGSCYLIANYKWAGVLFMSAIILSFAYMIGVAIVE